MILRKQTISPKLMEKLNIHSKIISDELSDILCHVFYVDTRKKEYINEGVFNYCSFKVPVLNEIVQQSQGKIAVFLEKLSHYIHPEDKNTLQTYSKQTLENKKTLPYIFRIIDPQTQKIYYLNRIVNFIEDVAIIKLTNLTEEKDKEDQEKKIHNQLLLSQKVAKIGSWEWDIKTNKVLWSNEAYNLFEINSKIPLTYEKFLSLLSSSNQQLIQSQVKKIMKDHIPYQSKFTFTTQNKKTKILEYRGHIKLDNNNRPISLYGIMQDITQQQESESKKEELLAKIDRLHEISKTGTFDFNVKEQTIIWNRRGYILYGIDDKFTPNYKTYLKLIHPDDRDRIETQFNKAIKNPHTSRYNQLYRIIKQDTKEILWLKVVSEIIRDDKGNATKVSGFIYDITKEKEKEAQEKKYTKQLEQYKNQLEGIHQAINGFVYIFKIEPQGNPSFTYISEGCKSIYNMNAETIMKDASLIIDIMLPDDRQRFEGFVQKSAEKMSPFSWEGRIIVNGVTKTLSAQSRPHKKADGSIVWTGICMDISEKEKLKKEKNELNFYFEEIQNELNIGVFHVNIKEKKVTSSPSTSTLLGIPIEKKYSISTLNALLHPEDKDSVIKNIKKQLKNKDCKITSISTSLIKQDTKKEIWVTAKLLITRNKEGSPIEIKGFFIDINNLLKGGAD